MIHEDPKVNNEFIKWVDSLCGDDELGRVTANGGKKHDFLGMILDCTEEGVAKINMTNHVNGMIDSFKHNFREGLKTPANENLFKVNPKSPKLSKERCEEFHTVVAKGLVFVHESKTGHTTCDRIPVHKS